jgi:hypothetical protein
MDIERILRNIDRVIQEVPEYAAEILVTEHKRELLAIQENQLLDGIRGDGQGTKDYISDDYVKRENKQSAKSYPRRNYKKEGDFYGGLDIAAEGEEVLFFSLDSKAAMLEEEEDGELLSIAPQNRDKVDNINGFAKKLITKTGNELSK